MPVQVIGLALVAALAMMAVVPTAVTWMVVSREPAPASPVALPIDNEDAGPERPLPSARVLVDGAARIELEGVDGGRVLASEARPGTWEPLAWFDDALEPTRLGPLELAPGDQVSIRCDVQRRDCTVTRGP